MRRDTRPDELARTETPPVCETARAVGVCTFVGRELRDTSTPPPDAAALRVDDLDARALTDTAGLGVSDAFAWSEGSGGAEPDVVGSEIADAVAIEGDASVVGHIAVDVALASGVSAAEKDKVESPDIVAAGVAPSSKEGATDAELSCDPEEVDVGVTDTRADFDDDDAADCVRELGALCVCVVDPVCDRVTGALRVVVGDAVCERVMGALRVDVPETDEDRDPRSLRVPV